MNNFNNKVKYCTNDQFTLDTLLPLLQPITNRINLDVTLYIFSEKDINHFVSSFCALFTGGPSIILIDKKFRHLLKSMLLNVTSEIITLNKPLAELIPRIEGALGSKKMSSKRDFSDDAFNLMGMVYHLNDREKDVMGMILDGCSPTEIANELEMTSKTVSSCKLSAMAKMGVSNLVEVQTFMRLYTMLIQRQGTYLFN